MVEIKDKKILIVGTGGSGKTHYSKRLWGTFKLPLAYDINGDFEKLPGGVSFNPSDVREDMGSFLDLYDKIRQKRRVDALFFDDADAYLDYSFQNSPRFRDLVIRQRNAYKVSLVFIAKKPQALPTIISENAHRTIIFKSEGVNVLNRLEAIDERILPMMDQVYKSPYSYIVKDEGEAPVWMRAIK